MKTTKRFEEAITRLYNAFHNGTLNAFQCKHCAVGNIVANGGWIMHLVEPDGEMKFADERDFNYAEGGGYTGSELLQLEAEFLIPFSEHMSSTYNKYYKKHNGFFYNMQKDDDDRDFYNEVGNNKDLQFEGLCNVVEFLAKLDNIQNPMDYSKLFEIVDGKPKYELVL